MKDIPVFTTEYGVASLILKEIPYRKRAHIKLQATQEPDKLLEECVAFCRACGAEWIDAAGHEYLEKYPLITEMWLMTCSRDEIEETDACLFPMTDQTVDRWLEIHNQRMTDVPNAAYLDRKDGREFLENGDCYFIHRNGKLLGIGKAAEDYIDIDDQHTFVAGMDFDADGVLWYTCMSFRVMENEHYKAPAGFFRWDFLHGGKPEFLGLFGTPERVQTYSCSLAIDKKRDILYSASTNHSYGSPDIIAVDLGGFRKVMHEKGPVCRDMLVYAPGYEEFRPFGDHWQHVKEQIASYAANLKAKDIRAVRLWREFSRTNWSAAAVKALRFTDDTTLEGICGNAGQTWHFTVRDGRLASLAPASDADIARLRSDAVQTDTPMPCYPGRQWRSAVRASCEWTDGAQLVGTEDGFLAILRADGSVYSLGPAICQGPVRALCADPVRGIAYGVGGDTEDIGNVFRYTEAEGLRYLGYVSCDRPDDDTGTCANFVLSCCALSPDGCTLAIGAADRLSCVYICKMEE